MKTFIAMALMATSLSSFAEAKLQSYGERKEYEQYFVSSDKAGTVTVKVDSQSVTTDCHGLSFAYTKDTLSNGTIMINKEALAHTMQMCGPETYVVEDGIKFTVEFKRKYGGYQMIMVPVGAKVVVE